MEEISSKGRGIAVYLFNCIDSGCAENLREDSRPGEQDGPRVP